MEDLIKFVQSTNALVNMLQQAADKLQPAMHDLLPTMNIIININRSTNLITTFQNQQLQANQTERQLSLQQQENQTLQNTMYQLRNKMTSLEEKLKHMVQTEDVLAAKNRTLEQQAKNFATTEAKLEAALAMVTNQLHKVEEEKITAGLTVKNDIVQLKEQVASLKSGQDAELHAAKQKLKEKEQELDAFQKNAQETKNQLQKQLASVEDRLKGLSDRHELLELETQQQIKDYDIELQKAKMELQTAVDAASNLKEQLNKAHLLLREKEITVHLNNEETVKPKTENELEARLLAENDRLKLKITDMQNKQVKVHEELQQKNIQNQKLIKLRQELEMKLTVLNRDIQKEKDNHMEETDFKREIIQRDSIIEQLNQSNKQQVERIMAAASKIQQLETKTLSLSDLERKQAENQELILELFELKTLVKKLKNALGKDAQAFDRRTQSPQRVMRAAVISPLSFTTK